MTLRKQVLVLAVLAGLLGAGCSKSSDSDAGSTTIVEGACQIPAGDIANGTASTEFVEQVGCSSDFIGLSSEPLDASIPGARSMKVVLDTADSDHLYFQNSVLYQVHYDFVSTHLSGNGLPIVTSISQFNTVQYYQPDRRFVLG